MPKIKTHRGAAKRFKRTATGKLKRARSYTGHFFVSKSSKRKRGLRRTAYVSDGDRPRIERLLPNK